MGYHFAFMAISIAVFGTTLGSLYVYFFPKYFSFERIHTSLAVHALLFASSTVLALLTSLSIPFYPHLSLLGIYSTLLTFMVVATPFFFSGVCIATALTKLPEQVSQLYAADLLGATAGVISYVYALKVTDGPTAVFLAAAIAGLAGVCFAWKVKEKRLVNFACTLSLVLCVYVIGNTILTHQQRPLLHIVWSGVNLELPTTYEKWNATWRIAIRGSGNELEKIVSADNASYLATLPVRIEPPTDDCPFFFYMFTLRNLFNWRALTMDGRHSTCLQRCADRFDRGGFRGADSLCDLHHAAIVFFA